MLLVLPLAIFLTAPSPAWGQDMGQDMGQSASEAEPPPQRQDGAGPVKVDPATGRRYREVRPREAIRRGSFRVPRWVPAALGAGVTVIALGVLAVAHRRRSRR
ncbi:MAG: hypothetical protein DRJ42_09640 [Deltaproteobacteria bacterium]|nr:MAG: hypothetical protein DRJ42_09640 [Deltaproteobacteria bacterium]